MQVLVVHDKQGNIKSLGVPGPHFQNKVGLKPQQDEQVSVVERADVTGEQLFHELQNLHQNFRVDVSSGTPKLVQK